MDSQIIAVANEKGGVGKTVTVINLAAALGSMGRKVLIVDTDPQANATKGLGVELETGQVTVYDLINPEVNADASDAIRRTRWKGLDIIPSHVDLVGAEVELVNYEGRENCLRQALSGSTDTYEYVLLDTPPSLSLLTVNVFALARYVLVPCQTHPYAFSALEELFDTIRAVKEQINDAISVLGIIPTFVDPRTRVSALVLKQLQEDPRYKNLLFKSMIRTNITIAESAAVGRPVVFYKKNSNGAVDYISFAGELDRYLNRNSQ